MVMEKKIDKKEQETSWKVSNLLKNFQFCKHLLLLCSELQCIKRLVLLQKRKFIFWMGRMPYSGGHETLLVSVRCTEHLKSNASCKH